MCNLIQNYRRNLEFKYRLESGPEWNFGVAIHHRLDAPLVETWLRDFPHKSRPFLGSNQPPIQWVLCLFQWVK